MSCMAGPDEDVSASPRDRAWAEPAPGASLPPKAPFAASARLSARRRPPCYSLEKICTAIMWETGGYPIRSR